VGLELRAASSLTHVVELEAGSGGCKETEVGLEEGGSLEAGKRSVVGKSDGAEVGQEEGGTLEAVYVEAVGSTDGAEVGLEEGRTNKRPSPSVKKPTVRSKRSDGTVRRNLMLL